MVCDWPVRIVSEDGELFTVRCGSTDAAMCESCAQLYAGDVRQLVVEGLEAFGDRPLTLLTFTAPGRELGGRVHSQRLRRGQARPCGCGQTHGADDSALGTPVDPASFDYGSVVRWNARSRRLLTVTLQKVWRLLGERLPYLAVAELQGRGALHWHVIVAGLVPASVAKLAVAGGRNRATGRTVQPTRHDGAGFGVQVDAAPIFDVQARRRIAWYVSKYLTKSLSSVDGDRSAAYVEHRTRLAEAARRSAGSCAARAPSPFVRQSCRSAGHQGVPKSIRSRFAPWAWDSCPRRRRAMRSAGHLGRAFTRGKRWPVTLGDLRERRRCWAAQPASAAQPTLESTSRYVGRGYGDGGWCLPELEIAG